MYTDILDLWGRSEQTTEKYMKLMSPTNFKVLRKSSLTLSKHVILVCIPLEFVFCVVLGRHEVPISHRIQLVGPFLRVP